MCATTAEKIHFEFHEWETAFAEFYRRRALDPLLCFVVVPDGYGSGYWIEPCSGGVDVGNSEPYNLVGDVKKLERRIRNKRAKTKSLSLGGVIQ